MNKHGGVAVRDLESGAVLIHALADPGGGYGTLCGLSTDDDVAEVVDTPPNARINCTQCYGLWKTARSFKARDFATKDAS